jgi:CheY-like chemotaxis protein
MNTLKRILLVEDNPFDAELTVAALADARLGNDVFVVRDGAEALAYLRNAWEAGQASGLPAVILLDLKMPRVDGFEVVKKMKADERFRDIPVVMLTSSGEERDVQESYRLGVNAYVVKPLAFQSFVDAIKGLRLLRALINEPPGPASRPSA